MNFVIKQTELFIKALKISHSIEPTLKCYFSSDGILLLSNFKDFQNLETKKPSFICYFNSNSFQSFETQCTNHKMPQNLTSRLQNQLQDLNSAMTTISFELNITHLYPTLHAMKKQIKKIEIKVIHTIECNRLLRKLIILLYFKESFFSIEQPLLLDDDIEEMEKIRNYIKNRQHLDIFETDPQLADLLKDNLQEQIQFNLNRYKIEISTKTTLINVNNSFFTLYNYDAFKQTYPNLNTITIEPHILQFFQGYGFKLSIIGDQEEKQIVLISKNWLDETQMVLKSISTLINKIKVISILDENNIEPEKDNDVLDIINEFKNSSTIQQQQQKQPIFQQTTIEDQLLRKKVKVNQQYQNIIQIE